MNTVFLLTHVPNPRMNKRIDAARKLGEVTVVCLRRSSQNTWEPLYQDIKHEIAEIDLPSASHLLKRTAVSKQYKKYASSLLTKYAPDLIYTSGLDSLGIAIDYKKRHRGCKIIYEVADLRESFIEKQTSLFGKLSSAAVKQLEKMRFPYVDRLVVTSEKFYDVHYCKLIGREKMLFLPNVPDLSAFESYEKKTSGEFTVGFIGGIRYLKQMKMLVDAAEQAQCKVLFAGAGGTSSEYAQITKYCENKPHVRFTGRYDYNREIAGLYGAVDCVYAVYNADNANVRIALPNKLYESVYCQLPLIVAKGTYLSEMVENWGVGVAVAHNDIAQLRGILEQLKNDRQSVSAMAAACAAHRADVDWAVYAQKLVACLTELSEESM